MKKLFAIFLMLVYGVTSFGMTLNMHYCCGKLDKVSFSSNQTKACKSTATIHSKGCCDNKKFELKIKADQETGSKQTTTFSFQPLNLFSLYSSNIFLIEKSPLNVLSTGPPLTLSATPLFIKYCIYRI